MQPVFLLIKPETHFCVHVPYTVVMFECSSCLLTLKAQINGTWVILFLQEIISTLIYRLSIPTVSTSTKLRHSLTKPKNDIFSLNINILSRRPVWYDMYNIITHCDDTRQHDLYMQELTLEMDCCFLF